MGLGSQGLFHSCARCLYRGPLYSSPVCALWLTQPGSLTPVPAATMSTQRLRRDDYQDYSSTDASPQETPSEELHGAASLGSYQRLGESQGTT